MAPKRTFFQWLTRQPAIVAPEVKSLTLEAVAPLGTAGRAHAYQYAFDPRALIHDRAQLSSWVYDCIRLRAESLASVRWYAVRQTSEGESEALDPQHPLNTLLGKANKHWTFSEFSERAQMGLDSTGNAYITILRVRGVPREMWVMPPGTMSPIPSDSGNFIDGYESNVNGRRRRVAAEDVIHLQYPNINDPYCGLAPMESIKTAVDLDVRSVEWNRSLIENRAVPETVVSFPGSLGEKAYDNVIERLQESHQGPECAGTPWVLDSGAKMESFGTSPRDMDWLASRRFAREEICSAFNVSPLLIGALEGSTFNNIATANKMFWANGMVPVMRRWTDQLNLKIAPAYGEDVRVKVDVSHIDALQVVTEGKMNAAAKLWGMGVPINVINEALNLGLPNITGGDMGYVPSSAIPSAANTDGFDIADDVPGEDGDEEERLAEVEADAEKAAFRAALDRRTGGHGVVIPIRGVAE